MDWLLSQLQSRSDAEAMVGHGGRVTYAELAERTSGWLAELSRLEVAAGECVAIVGNASPHMVALFTALAVRGAVVVPFAPTDPPEDQRARRVTMAHATRVVEFGGPDEWTVRTPTPPDAPRPRLLTECARRGEAGLLLFSSGSTGESKAALLSLPRLLGGFRASPRPRRTLQFMALDHIGGVNTLFRTLIGGGTVVAEPQRTPKHACEAIHRHGVQVLPTTPTFLNMLLLSDVHRDYDLSSLELITYGTDPCARSPSRTRPGCSPRCGSSRPTASRRPASCPRGPSRPTRCGWTSEGRDSGRGCVTEFSGSSRRAP